MSKTSETGHVKNAANFEQILSFCNDYGSLYNPSKASIQLAKLTDLHATSQAVLGNVINKNTAFKVAINARQAVFANFRKLSTKLINALAATDAGDKTVLDAKGINRKIQGVRAIPLPRKKKEVAPPKNTELPAMALVPPPIQIVLPIETATPAVVTTSEKDKTISASQQSFDQLMAHFSKLIALLESEPNYLPNETELQTATLRMLLANMKSTNTDVIKAITNLSNSRIARNEILYNKQTGLCNTAREVKNYVKSLFGASSPQFKQVSGIHFKDVL